MKTLSVYSWDPCDQYYQLTDRWGLVPASQLPVSALLSELVTHVTGDHPDTLRKWLYPDTHSAYLSHHWYFRLLPLSLLISHFYLQVSMQSNSHSLAGLGSYPLSHSHLPPIKAGAGSAGVAGSPLTGPAPPQTSPDLECGPVSSDYNEKSPNTWKYQSFQVL